MKLLKLPKTYANELKDNVFSTPDNIFITITKKQDEKELYRQLSDQLLSLEKSFVIDFMKLEAIEESAKKIKVEMEYRESLFTRIDWVYCLYQAWEKMAHIETLQQAKEIMKSIAVVQTSPLKNKIKQELETIINTLQSTEFSQEEELMNLAIEQAGNEFINLNSIGREYIISQLIKQQVETPTIKQIQEYATLLNERSNKLKLINSEEKFKEELFQLPLTTDKLNSDDNINSIIFTLMNKKDWNGIAELDQIMTKLNQEINNEINNKKDLKRNALLKKGNVNALDKELAEEHHIILKV